MGADKMQTPLHSYMLLSAVADWLKCNSAR